MTLRLSLLIPLLTLGIITSACAKATPHIVKRSEGMGDFVADTRKPKDVCTKILKNDKTLKKCSLTAFKTSNDKKECVGNMSIAGCFACTYRCP